MMYRICFCAMVIFTVTLYVNTLAQEGTWVNMFKDGVADDLKGAVVSGDYLWYVHGLNKIKVISLESNTVVKTITLDTSRTGYYRPKIIANGLDHALFWEDGKKWFFAYDSGVVTEMQSNYSGIYHKVESSGAIGYFDVNTICRFDGTRWDTLRLDIPDTMIIYDYVQDNKGMLWVLAGSDFKVLYKYDGKQLVKIARDISGEFCLFKDPNGNPKILSRNKIKIVENDQLVTYCVLTEAADLQFIDFDTAGNVWYSCFDSTSPNGFIVKTNPGIPGNDKRYSLPPAERFICYRAETGIAAFTARGYYLFDDRSGAWTYFSLRSINDNRCGEIVSPSPSMSKFCFSGNDSFYISKSTEITLYSENGCYDLPVTPGSVNEMCMDGNNRLCIAANNGLYYYEDSKWIAEPALKDVMINHITIDKNGNIWCSSNDVVFQQSGNVWQQITSSNSPLTTGACKVIKTGTDGTIWLLKGGTVHSTPDGKSWTIYDSTNSVLPASKIKTMQVGNNGHVGVTWTWSDTNRAPFAVSSLINGAWCVPETIPLPVHPGSPPPFRVVPFVDSNRNIWCYGMSLYRYYNGVWTFYDSTNAPFRAAGNISEGSDGTLYAFANGNKYGVTMISFVRDNGNPVVSIQRTPFKNAANFSVRSAGKNRCIYSYTLQSSGSVELSLLTPQGRLVTTLFSETQRPGFFTATVPVRVSPGMYVARLKTGEGSYISPVLFR